MQFLRSASTSNLKETILNRCNSPTSVADVVASRTNIDNVRYSDLADDSLFKLLESFQWQEALCVLRETSRYETRQWVSKNEVSKAAWRRLPIHEACIRRPTSEIIAALLDAYPESAGIKDNLGRNPLHHAVIQHAHVDVIYLLLHHNYESVHVVDFFKKSPKSYAMGAHQGIKGADKAVIDALFRMGKQDITSAASRVRAKISKSLTRVRSANNPEFPNPRQISYKTDRMEALLEEELAQARVEADTAYSQRDIAMENENCLKKQVDELKELLYIRHEEVNELQSLSERNRQISFLMRELEEKQAAQDKVIEDKDKQIATLMHRLAADTQKKEYKLDAVKKKAEKEKKQLKATVSALTMKIKELEEENQRSQNESQDIPDDSSSASALAQLKSDYAATNVTKIELEGKFAASRVEKLKLTRKVEAAEVEVKTLEHDLHALESEHRECYDELVALRESSAKTEKSFAAVNKRRECAMELAAALEATMELYQNKLAKLEDAFYKVTEQLIQVTQDGSRSQAGSVYYDGGRSQARSVVHDTGRRRARSVSQNGRRRSAPVSYDGEKLPADIYW